MADGNKKLWSGLIGLVIIGFIAFGVWGIARKPKVTSTSNELVAQNDLTRSDIVNQFQPANSPAPSNMRGQETPVQPSAPNVPPAQPQVYTNAGLGFSVKLPAGAQAVQNGTTVSATSNSGYWQVIVYDAGGMTLSDIQTQLSGSPEVMNLSRINYNGDIWLSYYSRKSGYGWATIHSGRLYYVSASSGAIDSFKFL